MKISVIIPVRNGAQTLERCLASIRSQSVHDIELVILDSSSTDNSREIAARYGAVIVPVPEGSFNHGLTRNLGAQVATGEFLFYTVQDAWLSEDTLLEKMIQHFDDEAVVGVGGHQGVPHEKDKNPMLWYRRFNKPEVQVRHLDDVASFRHLTHKAQQSLIAWDDVVAMYRATALQRLPFADTQFAEDWIWSREALLRGWKLLYDPSIVVYHYHHAHYRYAYQAAYAVNFHLYKYFGFKPEIPGLFMQVCRALYHLGKHKDLSLKEKLYWMGHHFMSRLGTFNAHINFLLHVGVGGSNAVAKRYAKVCRQIPQGKLK